MQPTLAKRVLLLGIFVAAAGCGLVAISAADKPAAADPTTPQTPVLVELFTSEGCSSCPPADNVLAALERTQPVPGARVVPLGLHVDYWDRLGWTDPFSSARASERQRNYSPLGSGSYTPQAVIDGRAETVGSRRAAVEQAVAEAAKRPHASLGIDLAPRDSDAAPFELTLKIGALPGGSAADAEALVALTQNVAKIDVKSGENGGSMLEHTAIARDLVVAGAVPVAGGMLKATIKPPPGVAAKDLRFVAFVQEHGSRKILGTTTRDAR